MAKKSHKISDLWCRISGFYVIMKTEVDFMNKKEKELSSDEALIEVFKASFNYFDKTDKLNIEFLNKRK